MADVAAGRGCAAHPRVIASGATRRNAVRWARSPGRATAWLLPRCVMAPGIGGLGRYLVLLGALIAAVGLLLLVVARFPQLKIGRLPGDIYVERERWRFYFPLMSSILLSIVLSAILWLLRRR